MGVKKRRRRFVEKISDSYKLMDISIKDFVDSFYKEYPDLLKFKNFEAELLYSRHIENIKKKYSSKERDFLLMLLKEQFEVNKSSIVRFFSFAAIYVAIFSIVKDWKIGGGFPKNYFPIITAFSIIYIIIVISIIEIKYVKQNNKTFKIIGIFEYIKMFEEDVTSTSDKVSKNIIHQEQMK